MLRIASKSWMCGDCVVRVASGIVPHCVSKLWVHAAHVDATQAHVQWLEPQSGFAVLGECTDEQMMREAFAGFENAGAEREAWSIAVGASVLASCCYCSTDAKWLSGGVVDVLCRALRRRNANRAAAWLADAGACLWVAPDVRDLWQKLRKDAGVAAAAASHIVSDEFIDLLGA